MQNSRIVLLFIICLASSTIIDAQIKVATNNCVGIGEDDPVSKFSINDPGSSYATAYILNNKSTTSSRGLQVKNDITTGYWGFSALVSTSLTSSSASKVVGLKGMAYSSSLLGSRRSYGLWGVAGNATSGYNYGVYGELYGTGNGAAIFAATPGKYDYNVPGIYAGYFRGKVYVEGLLEYTTIEQVSDENVKKDIRLINDGLTSQVENLKTLNAIKYKLKTPIELNLIGAEVTDTLSIDKVALQFNDDKYTKDYIGLSAQDVQQVYPDLVNEGDDGYLRMNYIGLIPILIEAIKEQQATIEELKAQMEKLISAK